MASGQWPLDLCGGEVAGEDGKGGGGGGEGEGGEGGGGRGEVASNKRAKVASALASDTTSVTLRRLDVGATSPTSYRLLSLIKPID